MIVSATAAVLLATTIYFFVNIGSDDNPVPSPEVSASATEAPLSEDFSIPYE